MLLEVRNLKKTFKQNQWGLFRSDNSTRAALAGVSLTIEKGEALGLVGESGCGKSTLARCILRLESVDEGEVLFEGKDFLALRGSALRAARRRIQPVFQDPYSSLNPAMSVGAIVEEPMIIHRLGSRLERRQRVGELFQSVGLDADYLDRLPHEFSGGQRQRIAIARALACEPALLIADEPTSSLDVSVQARIINLLSQLRRDFGLTLLFISHGLPVVRHFCDRVAVMYRGRLAEVAPTDLLFSQPRHPYTRLLLASTPEPDPGWRPEVDLQIQSELPFPGELREVAENHWVAE